jgi:hypothetical protein
MGELGIEVEGLPFIRLHSCDGADLTRCVEVEDKLFELIMEAYRKQCTSNDLASLERILQYQEGAMKLCDLAYEAEQSTGWRRSVLMTEFFRCANEHSYRASEYDDDDPDDHRLWTMRTDDMGDYLEWSIRCDGEMIKGGIFTAGDELLPQYDNPQGRCRIRP